MAASNEDYKTAARCGIDILELANATRRGGIVTDLLVGIAISGIAMETLRKIRAKLDHATRKELIGDLQRIEAEREPFVDILARDRELEIAIGQENTTCDITSTELQDPEECGLSEDEQRELLQYVQKIIDLPDNLTSLTPRFLTKLPLDPFTGESFIYRTVADASFHVYSTGPKMFDGGGKFGPLPSVNAGYADLCLDENDYWQDCGETPSRKGLVYRIASSVKKWWREWRR